MTSSTPASRPAPATAAATTPATAATTAAKAVATAAAPAAAAPGAPVDATAVRPFRVEVPQADLDDLRRRLEQTRYPDELPGAGDAYGVPLARVTALVDHWLHRFDWRALEARLNAHPQFVTEIDGQDVHFLHARSSRPDALPLILTHGWPGSVIEFLDVIGPLTEPSSADAPAYHLVIPSLPGFGFSGPTHEAGWNRDRTALAWAELMSRLGYERYGAVGNDAGSMISPQLGRIDGEHVVGVHVTQLFSFPSGDPAEFADLDETAHAALGVLQRFYENKFSFNQVHSQQPQTLAYALCDSPVGLLGWNSQLLGDMDDGMDADFLIGNTAIYWLTGTAGSAIRFYYEDAHAGYQPPAPTTVPTGLAMFAGDFQSIRPFAERDHANIVSWHSYELPAGHYAAHLATETYVEDLRGFFGQLTP